MADNLTSPGWNATLATDLIGGIHYPRTKVAFGADGSVADVSSAAPLPVTIISGAGTAGLTDTELRATAVSVALDAPTLAALESITVTGPLTDTQLRATALPVSGTFFPATQPVSGTVGVTGTFWQATQPVSIAATVAVSGPLTDTQLRATPVATLADSYARIVTSTTITRLANTTAYAAGQVVGGSASANNAANRAVLAGISRIAGGVVQIPRIRLYKSNPSLLGTFDIVLFRGNPAAALSADAALFASATSIGSASSSTRVVGRFLADFTTGLAGSDGAEVGCVPRAGSFIQTSPVTGESDLYAVIVATGAYTPLSGETFSIVAEALSY